MPSADGMNSSLATGGIGSGTPVLLLHCSGSTGGQWAALAQRLAPRFQVLTPDIAGWGASGDRAGTPQTLENEAALLADLMAPFETQYHIVGHSMGGAIALRLALMQRARVKSLTLIEPVLFHLLRDGNEADRALYAEPAALAERMRTAGNAGKTGTAGNAGKTGTARDAAAASEAAMRAFVDYWNGPGAFDALDPAWRDQVRLRADGVAANFDALERATFPLNAVRAIAAPTLVMMGSATQPSAQRIAAKLFDVLPLAALATIHGAGHMLPFTHAGPVNDRILAHIRAADGDAGAILPATATTDRTAAARLRSAA